MTLPEMVLFRLLQGLFGASLVPLSQAVLLDIYPKEKHGSAMAMWGMGVMVGPILGPTLGGYLTEVYNWRWVFYINVPFGILTFARPLGLSLGDDQDREAAASTGSASPCSAIAIGAFQMMLDRGEQIDWFGSTEIMVEAVVAGARLLPVHRADLHGEAAVHRSARSSRTATSRSASLFIFVVGIILLASLALITPYLQNLMGYPVITAGMVLAPRGIGTMVAMMIVGRLINRVDPRLLLVAGLLLTAARAVGDDGLHARRLEWTLVRTGVLQGMGLGFMFVPLSTITFATLPRDAAHRRARRSTA